MLLLTSHESALVDPNNIMMVWISVEYKRRGILDCEKGPNGSTLERQCLPSLYVESFAGVVNINLRLAKTVRKLFLRVLFCLNARWI